LPGYLNTKPAVFFSSAVIGRTPAATSKSPSSHWPYRLKIGGATIRRFHNPTIQQFDDPNDPQIEDPTVRAAPSSFSHDMLISWNNEKYPANKIKNQINRPA